MYTPVVRQRGLVMNANRQAVMWIDHAQARLIFLQEPEPVISVIRPAGGTPHLHHKSNSIDDGHAPVDAAYLHEVGKALAGFDAVLVTGPGSAKLELMKHLAQHDHLLLQKVSAVQTVDHPTDGMLADIGRRHFQQVERGLAREG
jgi:hypothetical protein